MSTKTVVDSFRQAKQDLFVPELRSLRTESHLRDENQTRALQSLASELRLRGENHTAGLKMLSDEMKQRDEKFTPALQNLSSKLDFAIDIRERFAALEARLPRR